MVTATISPIDARVLRAWDAIGADPRADVLRDIAEYAIRADPLRWLLLTPCCAKTYRTHEDAVRAFDARPPSIVARFIDLGEVAA